MKRALGVVLLVATGCATQSPADPDAPKAASGFGLAPYSLHEECFKLAPGDRLDYRFSSNVPVAFNIHYHERNAVVMPIAREAVMIDSGIFQPALAQEYCLTWEAGAAAATLDYRFAIRRRSP